MERKLRPKHTCAGKDEGESIISVMTALIFYNHISSSLFVFVFVLSLLKLNPVLGQPCLDASRAFATEVGIFPCRLYTLPKILLPMKNKHIAKGSEKQCHMAVTLFQKWRENEDA